MDDPGYDVADLLEGLNEYHGVVLDAPLDQIPIKIAKEITRVGFLHLWHYQAFVNHVHEHYLLQVPLDSEIRISKAWRIGLEKLSKHRFVIEIETNEKVTWFQAVGDAPTEDESDWVAFLPPYTVDDEVSMQERMELRDAIMRSVETAGYKNLPIVKMIPWGNSRSGENGYCEVCRSTKGFSNPQICAVHRGLRVFNCLECGVELIHSTRTIREKVNF